MSAPPSLAREIFAVALTVGKAVAVICGVVLAGALILWPLRRNPLAAMSATYGLVFVGLIVFFGWQNWKWKKADFERQREREARDAERKAIRG